MLEYGCSQIRFFVEVNYISDFFLINNCLGSRDAHQDCLCMQVHVYDSENIASVLSFARIFYCIINKP